MRTIQREIVGGFIFSSDGLILLGRSIEGGVYKDEWMVPGGGIEAGETKLEAVKREILEEVGIDISDATVEEIEGVITGQSEKVLRETNERVLVKMNFYDYKVTLKSTAAETKLAFEDDLAEAQWFTPEQLMAAPVADATRVMLVKLGMIPDGAS